MGRPFRLSLSHFLTATTACLILFLLSTHSIISHVEARDPVYNSPHNNKYSSSNRRLDHPAFHRRRRSFSTSESTTTANGISSIVLASSAPWRYGSGSSQQQSRRSPLPAQYYQRDYSEFTIDYEQAIQDKRSRIYQVDFKSRRPNQFSWSTRLVTATVIAFGIQTLRPSFTSWGMKLSDRILSGQELHRLVTPIFLHGGVLHLMMNMVSLKRVGNDVEKLFGPGRFLATYMAAGVAGNIASTIQSPNPSLGASGAVFGIVGAYFVFLNRNDWLLGSYGQAMTNGIIQTIGMNFLLGLMNPRIDQWAHLGGALGGALMAYTFGPRLYISELPTSGRRIIFDRPVYRLPAKYESIPSQIVQAVQQVTDKVMGPIDHLLHATNQRPWGNHNLVPQQRIRRNAPNRSIKPGPVDDF